MLKGRSRVVSRLGAFDCGLQLFGELDDLIDPGIGCRASVNSVLLKLCEQLHHLCGVVVCGVGERLLFGPDRAERRGRIGRLVLQRFEVSFGALDSNRDV